jgi:hypothetical protein
VRKTIKILSIAVIAALWGVAPANDFVQAEIAHLLEFVDSSDCTFIRNGREYNSHDAVEHIRRKYEYVRSRYDVDSAEKFIALSATRSSISTKPYHIQCPGEERISSEQWLLRELSYYRRLVQ